MSKFVKNLYVIAFILAFVAVALFGIVLIKDRFKTANNTETDYSEYTESAEDNKINENDVALVNEDETVISESKEDDLSSRLDQENNSDDNTNVQEPEEEPVDVEKIEAKDSYEPVKIVMIGDTFFNERRQANYDKNGIYGVLSDSLIERTQNADVSMLDFECAFTERGEFDPHKEFSYRMKPSSAKAFKDMGFDVASLANNHALDFGTIGLSDTFDTLSDLGIEYVGAGDTIERAAKPAVFEINGRTVAFLAASRVIPVVEWNIINRQPGMLCTYDDTALCEAIKKAKSEYDYVIVYAHWGVMNTDVLESYQIKMAHDYIECGADLVFGSHPHVIQGVEIYKGKPIFYSLGNFLYGSTIERTFMLEANIDNEGVLTSKIIPCYAEGGKTMEMNEENGLKLYDYLNSIATNCHIDENGLVKEAD